MAGAEATMSEHFTLETMMDGVYAAVAVPGTGAFGNAGIVDLGDETLIFDTFWTLRAARDLRAAAERLTGRAPRYVINSHYNGDHIHGNQVFPEAAIIATDGTRELIATRGVEGMDQLRANGPTYVREIQEQLANAHDPARQRLLELELGTTRALVDELPELQLQLPNLTFTACLTLHGTHRRAEVLTYGGGHTASDAFLHLPDDHLIFMGDLLFTRSHPSIWHDDYRGWIRILERIDLLEPRLVVPGHGPTGGIEDVRTLHDYLLELERLATNLIERGGSEEDVADMPLPAPYAGWDEPDLFHQTLRRVYLTLGGRSGEHEHD